MKDKWEELKKNKSSHEDVSAFVTMVLESKKGSYPPDLLKNSNEWRSQRKMEKRADGFPFTN